MAEKHTTRYQELEEDDFLREIKEKTEILHFVQDDRLYLIVILSEPKWSEESVFS